MNVRLPLTPRCIDALLGAARVLLLGAALSVPPLAGAQLHKPPPPREGVDVGEQSQLARLVPAAEVESAAKQQYGQLLQQAAAKHALAPRRSSATAAAARHQPAPDPAGRAVERARARAGSGRST